MDEKRDTNRNRAIRDFLNRHRTLDELVEKLLTSKEADCLFEKESDDRVVVMDQPS